MSRETAIQIRVSHEERDLFHEKAEGWGVPLSAWVRARLLEAPAVPPEDPLGGDAGEPLQSKGTPHVAHRENWVAARARQIYGQGETQRNARMQAEREWEAKA